MDTFPNICLTIEHNGHCFRLRVKYDRKLLCYIVKESYRGLQGQNKYCWACSYRDGFLRHMEVIWNWLKDPTMPKPIIVGLIKNTQA